MAKKYGPANDAKGISQTHEHILVFGKQAEAWTSGLLPRNEEQLKAFKNPDNDPRGKWRASDFSVRTYNEKCVYEIIGPSGDVFLPPASRSWVVNELKFKELLADNRVIFGATGSGRPMQKKFLSEIKEGITPETWWGRDKVGDNKIARYELKELFPENVFDTPKPSRLIAYAGKIAKVANNDIVFDFFSGSGTAAHAVMALNAEDNGKRKSISVQLPELCDEASEAFKAGYQNISEIAKERIRRAGKKIQEDKPDYQGDLGFKVLKLAESNFKQWQQVEGNDLDKIKDQMEMFIDPIADGATVENMAYELMLKSGFDLNSTLEAKDGFYAINQTELVLLLETATQAIIDAVIALKPEKVIALDKLFKGNDQLKTNTALQMKDAAITFKTI